MSLKINKHVLVWSIITYLFVFQRALVGSISIFNYMDELFAIIVFNDTATTEIYTLSLHDALPICSVRIADPANVYCYRCDFDCKGLACVLCYCYDELAKTRL